MHEPESVEDITLEGERIQIEGLAEFEEDFLEREIEKELEEQHRAEITGSQRLLTGPDEASLPPYDDAVPMPGIEPLHDLESTDEFETLRDEVGAVRSTSTSLPPMPQRSSRCPPCRPP